MTSVGKPPASTQANDQPRPLCSTCFQDQGLRLYSHEIGIFDDVPCPNCHATTGRKLDARRLHQIAHRFFVWGTLERCEYGAAPRIQYNEHQDTDIAVPPWLKEDIELIADALGVGFSYYGPRLWMLGDVEPLKDLQRVESRAEIVDRIITEYPTTMLPPGDVLYRLRKDARQPADPREYDSPPPGKRGRNRFDSREFPVLYTSPNLQTCVHECRVSAEDDLFFATLSPVRPLKLLDLSPVLSEDRVTEFESLDMAVHMLFLAGEYSYDISQALGRAAYEHRYDGIMYPSYFSLLQTGAMPFETGYGLSLRRVPQFATREAAKIVPNVGLFGVPIDEGVLEIRCINRLVIRSVQYHFHYGPIVDDHRGPWTTDIP